MNLVANSREHRMELADTIEISNQNRTSDSCVCRYLLLMFVFSTEENSHRRKKQQEQEEQQQQE